MLIIFCASDWPGGERTFWKMWRITLEYLMKLGRGEHYWTLHVDTQCSAATSEWHTWSVTIQSATEYSVELCVPQSRCIWWENTGSWVHCGASASLVWDTVKVKVLGETECDLGCLEGSTLSLQVPRNNSTSGVSRAEYKDKFITENLRINIWKLLYE